VSYQTWWIKRIERDKLSGQIAGVETADKMTVPQIAAKVRKVIHT